MKILGEKLKKDIQAGCPVGNFECRFCEGSDFWKEGGRKLSPYQKMKMEWGKGEKLQRETQKE